MQNIQRTFRHLSELVKLGDRGADGHGIKMTAGVLLRGDILDFHAALSLHVVDDLLALRQKAKDLNALHLQNCHSEHTSLYIIM